MPSWRELPARLAALRDLALDLRWTWSHQADALWERIDAELWQRTRNPWTILADVAATRLAELASDDVFLEHLDQCAAARRSYLEGPGWFAATYGPAALDGVAYFSMEFGLGEALPLYAGGLGILAGDFLKTASDLGVPVVGVGLLFQEGYLRQTIDAGGRQQEAYPYNEPATMPIQPLMAEDGSPLHVAIELPGRILRLRVWRASVGRTSLYLLDSNSPQNSPVDRGITGKLYGGTTELRLMQEIVLGVGGWRLVEAIHPEVEVCHMNEGHAAFVVLERARSLAARLGLSFRQALWATRAGNVFTTHTPVSAGFDRFPLDLLDRYRSALTQSGIDPADVLALGRADGDAADAPLNMAYLAARGSLTSLGVSRRHGTVSRRIFQPLFPRWPEQEVPIGHVTNGVHVPSWDSQAADEIWTDACGKDRWRCIPDDMHREVAALSDATLWAMRGKARQDLVLNVRRRLRRHLAARGNPPEALALAERVLDPNVLTLGFARRFTAYKRPNLLLRDRDRFVRLLGDRHKPAQIVLAGMAHPADTEGKRMIHEWFALVQCPALRDRMVFLEDYDISLAQELVQGVDVWINTPRPPWEACGTSGMKVLVNGGLNLSVRDGWWDEAYTPEVGWTIDGGAQGSETEQDVYDAEALCAVLEREIVPEFYDRDAGGVPRAWLARIRRSMANLTPQYGSTRMVREYLEKAYLQAAAALKRRMVDGAEPAKQMLAWELRVRRNWKNMHLGSPGIDQDKDTWCYTVPVYLGEMLADDIQVELYADACTGHAARTQPLARGARIPGTANGYLYTGGVPASRPADHYTVRVIPLHPEVRVPSELPAILWQT
ncbi:MAG TPA: alpha-glucan family phosphorylase [Acetobacteraceae bacterium]|nr:alpha-glucan family phosphorylase [Acetobacteraceae bacterium]